MIKTESAGSTWVKSKSAPVMEMVISKERYWREFYEDTNYEWNNGYLEEKPMSSVVEFAIFSWFLRLLEEYLTVHPIAQTIGLETGFELTLPEKSTIRKPDVAVVLHSNPVPLKTRDRRYHGIFDICVESVSASSRGEIERDTIIKRQEYELAGVQEYYILDERGQAMAFLHQVEGRYQPLPVVDGVIASQVLPGFQFREVDLYRRPSLVEMAHDAVYQGYILPAYQQAEQRAAQAEAHAEEERQAKEQERQAKEQERQAKEKLAAKLSELGIDPTTLLP